MSKKYVSKPVVSEAKIASLKKMTAISTIAAVIASCLFVTSFIFAYINYFGALYNLLMFVGLVLTIFGWCWFYITYDKYQKAINPPKNLKIGSGNRKARRKKK